MKLVDAGHVGLVRQRVQSRGRQVKEQRMDRAPTGQVGAPAILGSK
jgi:hypothetical protein